MNSLIIDCSSGMSVYILKNKEVFSKIDNNSIKINLVTSKPYSSQVCVLNKGNNKYVILLPETENKITNNPLTHEFCDSLSGINVTTQPYIAEGCKGYTKIILTTTKPITFSAATTTFVQPEPAKTTNVVAQKPAEQVTTVAPKTTTPKVVAPKPAEPVKAKPTTQTKPIEKPVVQATKPVQPKVQEPKKEVEQPVTELMKQNLIIPKGMENSAENPLNTTVEEKTVVQEDMKQEIKPEKKEVKPTKDKKIKKAKKQKIN